MIPLLTNPSTIACHCVVDGDRLTIGVLVLDGEVFEPGMQTLYNPDNPDEAYQVEIPSLPLVSYNKTLWLSLSKP